MCFPVEQMSLIQHLLYFGEAFGLEAQLLRSVARMQRGTIFSCGNSVFTQE